MAEEVHQDYALTYIAVFQGFTNGLGSRYYSALSAAPSVVARLHKGI